MNLKYIVLALLIPVFYNADAQIKSKFDLHKLKSPVLFAGDSITAYRDPALMYYNGQFYLYFTLTEIEADHRIYMYTAMSKSPDLIHWSKPRKLTVKNQSLNFSSPGNVIRFNNEWIMCIQTYPRPNYFASKTVRYGDETSRLFVMKSTDLENWGLPELLKVKGSNVREEDMGRMIDPFLLRDKDDTTKYWCFYKQNGVSMSYSYDLKHWTYSGHTDSGENVCVFAENNQYILIHSPANGIGVKRSPDLKSWTDNKDQIIIGQDSWQWAKGRITAGFVLPLQNNKQAKYLMVFHGSGPLKEQQGDFDKNASIGIAWSNDLINWNWPEKNR